eukprot:220461-Pyramimonas_sp.AAC.1
MEFFAPSDEVKQIYADSSGKLLEACRQLGWRHDTSTPHRPHTNGIGRARSQAWCRGRNFATRPRHGPAATMDACADFSSHEIHFG